MRTMPRSLALLAAGAGALLLAACSEDTVPTVTVDSLSAGRYLVSTGDADAPTVGQYYAGADGSALLVLVNANDQASRLLRRAAGGDWVAVPASNADLKVSLLGSNAQPTASDPTAASLAGSYVAQVGSGVLARFTVDASGSILPGDTACQLSGTLAAGALPGTLAVTLRSTGCGTLPAALSGVLAVDSDYAPAAFRLLGDDGAQLADLWAYAE